MKKALKMVLKKIDPEKFENLVSYIASRVTLYKTSLNKFLWYIDFLNFKTNSRSITGLTYQKYIAGHSIQTFIDKLGGEYASVFTLQDI